MNQAIATAVSVQEQEFQNLTCLYEITRHLASSSSLQECLDEAEPEKTTGGVEQEERDGH